MSEFTKLLHELPRGLYTLATLVLLAGGILFIRSTIRSQHQDRLARLLIGVGLLTTGIVWYSFLSGLILR